MSRTPDRVRRLLEDELEALADVGLVAREKRGTWRCYEATERASAILSTLEGTRLGGSP